MNPGWLSLGLMVNVYTADAGIRDNLVMDQHPLQGQCRRTLNNYCHATKTGDKYTCSLMGLLDRTHSAFLFFNLKRIKQEKRVMLTINF